MGVVQLQGLWQDGTWDGGEKGRKGRKEFIWLEVAEMSEYRLVRKVVALLNDCLYVWAE